MKRALAIMLSAFLMAITLLSSLPIQVQATGAAKAAITGFEANTFAVEKGEKTKVKFTARISSDIKLNKNDVSVYDENGNYITGMRDDGLFGDECANDGIYTGVAKLYSDSVEIVNYHAQVGDVSSNTHSVKFHEKITDSDFDYAYALWDKLEAYEDMLANDGASPEEISGKVYNFLMLIAKDEIASIKVETERAFSFMLKSGIENYFEHYNDDCPDTDYESMKGQVKELSYIGESTIGVWSPYYGTDSSFSYNYKERAEAMQEIAGYDRVDAYYGSDASVNSFKNFDQYGIIMIDSHGASYNGGGYICIPRPGTYDQQDITEGHIVLSGSTVYLRGTFMQKYCETLPNTVIYIGICYGMAANNLYQPLINHGAGFVCGYDDSVSFTFDGIMMNEFGTQLVSVNSETGLQNTAGEAFAEAVRLHGDTDTYSSTRAKFIYRGNPDVVAAAIAVPTESVALNDTELTLYRLNTYKLQYNVTPIEANRYTIAWTSSDPETVSVSDKGVLTALKNGTATITLTLTDIAVEPANTLTAQCAVTVAGDMPVSGISIDTPALNIYSGTTGEVKAHVLPENATNQGLIYEVDNPEIATVDSLGKVTPVALGSTYIKITTEEGGFGGIAVVTVRSGDLNGALNVSGGTLRFRTSGSTPSVITDNARFAAQTANHSSSSSSTITLSAGTLKKGTLLSFDWKVSSESGYDFFSFNVNGSEAESISGSQDWAQFEYEIPSDGTYTFTWVYSKDYSESIGEDCGWLDNVELKGESIVHTVKFVDMDETVLSEQQVAHDSAATPPEVPAHTGYKFLAWDYDYSCIKGDISIHALYIEVETFTVTFVDHDGTVIDTQTVEIGESATAPTDPVREGYTFTGWDTDFTNVMSDITVTAQYTVNSYTITYFVDGEQYAQEQYNYGEAITPIAEPEKENYTFSGWSAIPETMPANDVRVDGTFAINTYTVTFTDGLTGETISTATVEHGADAVFPTAPEHDGYTFTGWDNDGKNITADTTITALYEESVTLGDLNGDGTINAGDAVLVLRFAAELTNLNDEQLRAGDVNADGVVNVGDAVLILRYAAGLIDKF